jgi:hypothetical protein
MVPWHLGAFLIAEEFLSGRLEREVISLAEYLAA